MFFISEAEDESTKPKENISARKKVQLSDDEDEENSNEKAKDNDHIGILDDNDDLERDEEDKEFTGLEEPANKEFKLGSSTDKTNTRTTHPRSNRYEIQEDDEDIADSGDVNVEEDNVFDGLDFKENEPEEKEVKNEGVEKEE